MAKKTSTKKTSKKAPAKKGKGMSASATRAEGAARTKRGNKAIAAADQENARLRDERAASKDGLAASERAMARTRGKKKEPALAATEKARKAAIAAIDKNIAEGGESGKQDHEVPSAKEKANDANLAKWKGIGGETKAPKQSKAKKAKPETAKRVSLLDAAATVLTSAKESMAAKAIVEAVVERGLWTPGAGKTPAATLHAAMIREISKKGDGARFRKVDRGQFTAGKGA